MALKSCIFKVTWVYIYKYLGFVGGKQREEELTGEKKFFHEDDKQFDLELLTEYCQIHYVGINHLAGQIIMGEQCAFLDSFANHTVERFNGIGGANSLFHHRLGYFGNERGGYFGSYISLNVA